MANRPKPTHLRILEGNPGRRPFNLDEPQPKVPTRLPAPPRFLGPEGKVEWRRVVKQLVPLGLYTELDRSALAAYCESWDTWRQAQRDLADNGMTYRTANGQLRKSPCVAIADGSLAHMRAFMIEFGMTPASRSRVSVNPPDDEIDRFLFGDS